MGPDLFRSRFVVLDTETTGFAADPDSRVVNLAGVIVEPDGTLGDTWSSLVRPDIFDPVKSAGAIAVHGITPETVKGQPNAYMARQSFQGWLDSNGIRWVTSYNVDFDRAFCERMGLALKWAPCVLKRSREHLRAEGLRRGAKLSDMVELLGVEAEAEAHRALPDALMAARVLVAIRRAEQARVAA